MNIDKMIKETYSEIQDRVRYSRKIKENQCALFTNDLVVNSDDDFSFLSYVRLSEHAMDVMLGGYKDTIAKVVKPKLCTVYKAEKINKETLFYNDLEKKQIETIAKELRGAPIPDFNLTNTSENDNSTFVNWMKDFFKVQNYISPLKSNPDFDMYTRELSPKIKRKVLERLSNAVLKAKEMLETKYKRK